jgi:hypothetical protein
VLAAECRFDSKTKNEKEALLMRKEALSEKKMRFNPSIIPVSSKE